MLDMRQKAPRSLRFAMHAPLRLNQTPHNNVVSHQDVIKSTHMVIFNTQLISFHKDDLGDTNISFAQTKLYYLGIRAMSNCEYFLIFKMGTYCSYVNHTTHTLLPTSTKGHFTHEPRAVTL